ncbi:hypothetical protein VTO42DRAFT_1526 [Malbranchea cinnamomea]
MPPSKKKKKPASNPARGFATVSVPSKQKATAITESLQQPSVLKGTPDPSEKQSAQKATGSSSGSGSKQELHQLSPEELEKHLEEAELLSLVEKYAAKCKNEASRQVDRLETERRVLRPQAQPLSLINWLPRELLDQILEKEKLELRNPQSLLNSGNGNEYSRLLSEEEMCARLWTLQQTLLELGFPESKVTEALKNVPISASNELSGSKDSIPCLEQAMEWLAMHCDESELPQYGQRKQVPTIVDSRQTDDKADATTSGATMPGNNGSRTPKPVLSEPPTPLDFTSEESDVSDDPQSLVPRYVSLLSHMYKIQPSLFNAPKGKSKKSMRGREENAELDPRVARLQQKLKKIESDILFDSDVAEQEWQARLAELRIETAKSAQQLRSQVPDFDTQRTKVDAQPEPVSKNSKPKENAMNEEEDEGGILGDLFLSEEAYGEEPPILGISLNTTIKQRDFGKSSGMNPRRILEESCRARDSGYNISYRDIFSAPHSHRKLVEIKWSKAQSMPLDIPLDDISCQADSRSITVSMNSISTPTSQQAESYVSVIALFVLFSSSPKESRVSMRLPPVWKDLWAELADIKKVHEEKANIQAVRRVKNLLHENISQLDEDVVLTHNFKRRIGASTPKESDPSEQANRGCNSDQLKELWAERSSSDNFRQMMVSRQSLPIWQFKQQILEILSANQAMIICSETGSGKSTQIPSFILENELVSGRHCKIYVTEPRRISAMSLAKRVSEELGEGKNAVGTPRSLVGYAIRLESKLNASTRLIYATTGVVIRMLERPQEFQDITHLVLDEVHERTIDSDFLLIILRRLLRERPNLKLILMSATVDARRFSDYLHGAPILDIPGRTFPVEVKFLEDAIELSGYRPDEHRYSVDTDDTDEESPERTSEEGLASTLTNYSRRTRDAVMKYDEYRMDYRLIVSLLSKIATSPELEHYSKAILVFMPGLAEIRRLHDEILSEPLFEKGWIVHPLHSSIATEDQEKAFLIPPRGVRKIVIATNIAETGITIPDITAVIDTGKEKVMRFDEKRQISRLVESFISRANAKQRRGRAGRVQSGICFHLFTRYRHDKIIPDQQTPEMLRLSLQDLILRVKICKMGDIEGTLSEALDPPSAKNIRRAIEALKEVKALTEGEALTPLGRQLARLPLDVFLGKLILYGTVFKCLDAAVSIAAILSCKSPFVTSVGSNAHNNSARHSFNRGDSDLLTLYNAYTSWKKIRSTPGMNEFTFCRKNSLSPQALLNIDDVKTQLIVSIVDMGLLKLDAAEQAALSRARFTSRNRQSFTIPSRFDINSSNDTIVNSVIAWSFYPRLLTRDRGKKGWRNIFNNQPVVLHPTSVNKNRPPDAPPLRWLSYYHIMQARNRNYNAHETSAVEDIAVVLLCGDVAFKMYSGLVTIDGSRIRFAVRDWKTLLALKALSTRLREILTFIFRDPKRAVLSTRQEEWLELWQKVFEQGQGRSGGK